MTKSSGHHAAVLHTCSGVHALRIRLAASFLTRFAGLMLRPPLDPDQGLLLKGCRSVHTAFMRAPIDVVYLDDVGMVCQCVAGLKPWRGSFSGIGTDAAGLRSRAAHTLELAAGTIARLAIRTGDRLEYRIPVGQEEGVTPAATNNNASPPPARLSHPSFHATTRKHRQRGASMVEFVVVGPLITLIGMAVLQYGLLFFSKNHINHASFLAARAGSMANASLASAREAYERGLVPLYGGGDSERELNETLQRVRADTAENLRIELLNPIRESFDDWNDPALQQELSRRHGLANPPRVIPNAGLAFRDPGRIGAASGQSIQDANLIKLRITHGVEAQVPLVRLVYRRFLQWLDTGDDLFHTQLVNAGRIPVVSTVTLQMQSDAHESDSTISLPGQGNGGNPADPGDPPATGNPPPDCRSTGCSAENDPATPGGPGGGGSDDDTPSCPASTTTTSLPSDPLFNFGQSTLSAAGRRQLDQLIAAVRGRSIGAVTITGHTDQLAGTGFDNHALSLARARTVRDYLVNNGFPAVPITVEGRGADEPVVPLSACPASGQAQKDCLALNRRVEITFSGLQ